jgi:hypothetical protein
LIEIDAVVLASGRFVSDKQPCELDPKLLGPVCHQLGDPGPEHTTGQRLRDLVLQLQRLLASGDRRLSS